MFSLDSASGKMVTEEDTRVSSDSDGAIVNESTEKELMKSCIVSAGEQIC